MRKVTKAIIPVAGNGTRFLPFTKTVPKEMLPIINKPTIDYIVDEAIASGIEEIIFITAANKTALVDYFDRNFELERSLEAKGKYDVIKSIVDPSKKAKFVWIRQHEAKGLGHAVSLASLLIEPDETFALLLGDDVIYNNGASKPALQELVEVYEQTGLSVLGVQEVPKENISSYGVISPSEELSISDSWKIDSVVEKPKLEDAPSNLAVVGRYLLNAKIFDYLAEGRVDKATNEIQITDSILMLAKEKGVAARKLSGLRYDMGSISGFLKAQIEYAYRNPDYKADVIKIIKELKIEE